MELLERTRLKIYISENDKYQHRLLYERIVNKAQELGISGVTVTRGVMSFGSHCKLHYESILRISEDLPIIVEIIDSEENIQKFLPFLKTAVTSGMVTTETIKACILSEAQD